jgi:hypothetical protein
MKHKVRTYCVKKRAINAYCRKYDTNDQNFFDLLKILVVFASCIEMASQGSKYRTKYSWHKNMFLFSVFLWEGGHKK